MKNKILIFLVFIITLFSISCTTTNNEIYNRSYNVDIDITDINQAFIPATEKAVEASVGVILYERKVFMGSYSAVSVGSGVVYSAYAVLKNGETINNIEETKERNDVSKYVYKCVTNEHVLSKYNSNSIVKVYFGDLDLYYEATILGVNPKDDLAVISFEASIYLTPIVIANSDTIKQGELCLAIGNPEGLDYHQTVTFGIISYPKRYIEVKKDTDGDGKEDYFGINEFVQHDAAINPGNSGGALVNIKGELIGINTMKIMNSDDTIEGLGFAIPSNVFLRNIPNLETNTLYLGIEFKGSMYSVNELKNSYLLNLPNITIPGAYPYEYGVYIEKVEVNVGLINTDIVVEVNGIKVYTKNHFYVELRKYTQSDTLRFLVFRKNEVIEIEYKINK